MAHQQALAAAEQARVAVQNHITGIFSKSVELMGLVRETKESRADGTLITRSAPNFEARLGALYSLERLLYESERDQRAILETLCAYVRENAALQFSDEEASSGKPRRSETPPAALRRADIQAALTIIGRRPERMRIRATKEGWGLDLRDANLVAFDLASLNYDRADFSNSFLDESQMSGASLADCVFRHSSLRAAKLKGASFRSSTFTDCNFDRAEIDSTAFHSAVFINTDLRKAAVTSLSIEGANFEEAFAYSFDFSLKQVKESGPDYFNSQEILSMYALFAKAKHDENTSVSQSVRDAIEMMTAARSAREA